MFVRIIRNSGKTVGESGGLSLPPFIAEIHGATVYGSSGYSVGEAISRAFQHMQRVERKRNRRRK